MTSDIRERLARQHVLLTGVTGFVGEALLHLLLTEVPGVRLSVLVRPKGSISGADRIAKLLAKPIFETVADAQVGVVEGDLSDPPPLPGDLDAVVHSAGDVSFDPPVDEGFTTNVVGVRELLRRIEETGRDIHYLHVSTAYVSGRRRGHIPEGPVEHAVDVDTELAWGLAQRAAAEERSRSVEVISRLRKQAEREHGRAGLITAAAATEEARKKWVKDELVRLGAERARSLGWTDCYTFTKALGERVVEAYAATGHRATIYRPAIIESAISRPHPGWIEGFKMAEPLILAYGRGELPLFPAAADTAIDIVPVDHVVASIVACLAHPPAHGEPAYFHLASGDRNPVTFGMLYENVRAYFSKEPFAAGDRGAARLPEWTFPGGASVERMMATGEKVHKIADTLLGLAPRSDRTRSWARALDRQGRRLKFLRRYLDLYKEYAQADLRFVDANTLALYRSLSPADQETFAFDTGVIDWHDYLYGIHVPSVTKPVRELDELRKLRKKPVPGRLPRIAAGSEGSTGAEAEKSRVAAFFDLDGTLMSSNVIETYLWLRLGELSGTRKAAEIARMAGKVPGYVWSDRAERSSLLRTVYKEYAGARLSELDAIVDEHLTAHILGRLAPDAVRRIREHRAAGHVTVLVTGAIRPLTRPLLPLFDHIEAADLAVDDRGFCTGHLASSPLVGESRGAFVREWSRRESISPADCFAYADSHSDLPLLAAVGHPVAVRPDVPLFRHAKRSHWPIADWGSPAHTTRTLDPVGRSAR
ncbi:HAD superfamily hydrolase (TIGR01490 family) [Nocardioides luteus]|uniref:HAD-IB family hydrolase n=1 Tax=Nocardioides luteus TaxID=1844 RepID=UPI00198996EA|nr:HAD-IB family hydrolase [Nocardioides luteus]MDR7311375.1 HAD superfamily hydrolase (TIGR01490 family) [Nocardioides luteus]GGR65478.1 haloacid dehalogenase [Nocardioides luteus]